MINYIIINGTNSNTINGLGINELPPISKPPLRVQTDTIDGRDGDITTNLGYGAYDKTITIGLFGTGYDINEVISFFNGEGTVVFSNEPDKYYKYKIINQIDYEALLKFKSASITFHCQPFKYPLEEIPIEIEYEYIEQDNVESATLNNTNGGTSLDISLKGNTSQYTTTGKNILHLTLAQETTTGGIKYKPNSDTSITITGSREQGLTQVCFNLKLKKNTTYYFFCIDKATMQLFTSGTIQGAVSNGVNIGIGGEVNFNNTAYTTNENVDESALYNFSLKGQSNGVQVNGTYYFMVCEVNDSSWEPYTNGASPNPDYPQPINVVSGDNEVVVCGKQLWDEEYMLGYWGNSGEYVYRADIICSKNPIPVNPNNSYYFNSPSQMYYCQYNSKGEFISRNNLGNGYGVLTLDSNCAYILFNMLAGYGTTYNHDIMINKGTTEQPYEPYNGDTYELDLGVENIANINTSSTSIGGVDFTINNGIININGTTSSGASGVIFNNFQTNSGSAMLWLEATGYTDKSSGNSSFLLQTSDDGSSNWAIVQEVHLTTTATHQYNITLDSSKYYRLYWYTNANTFTNATIKVQLEYGTKKNSFTPYGTTPIELCKISTYQDYFTKNSGKNLLNVETPLSFTGTKTITFDTPLEIGSYVFSTSSWQTSGANSSSMTSINYEDGTTYNFITNNNDDTKTRILNLEKKAVSIKMYSNSTDANSGSITATYTNLMIEKGQTKTSYEPYGTGLWCKYNAIGEVVLDGDSNLDRSTSNENYTAFYMVKTDMEVNKTLYSNYFKQVSISTLTNAQGEGISPHNTLQRIYIGISTSVASSSNELKTWLSTHNTIVYYALKTPYLSLIEDTTLISQLDNIENAISYEGQTNVSQDNNDKPFLLDLIAIKKGTDEVVINNIGNTYSKPTIALEGTGITDIYLNNTQILKVDLTDTNTITIDTNNMEAYNPTDNTLANRKVVGNYNSMTLPSGNTTMKITGALEKATITDYSRWL